MVRAVAMAPPVAPPLARGVDNTMVRLLGDWKKPKPAPHSAVRQTMPALDTSAGMAASRNSPRAITARPAELRIALGILSAR